MRIVVTGGSGKGGAWVVRDLREHGHHVLNVDARHDGSAFGLCLVADLTDLGQTLDAFAGADAVVHFAAIPAPQLRPEGETFRINALSTYNVFAAAVAHRLRRVVWASSETVLGLPFDIPPAFAVEQRLHVHPSIIAVPPYVERCAAVRHAGGETCTGSPRYQGRNSVASNTARRRVVAHGQRIEPKRRPPAPLTSQWCLTANESGPKAATRA